MKANEEDQLESGGISDLTNSRLAKKTCAHQVAWSSRILVFRIILTQDKIEISDQIAANFGPESSVFWRLLEVDAFD